ncbi:MAG: twin-arginine translocase TatA/TatE family subunit [Deltaproteobacteria bacterium]|nr:MAG: twin-arginine translocase TatA/TatE family subunit [Deltaproteobacteria bacterium]
MTVELATFGVWELILILLIVVVIFGAGKLPQLGESMGKAVRNFRQSFKGEEKEVEARAEKIEPPQQAGTLPAGQGEESASQQAAPAEHTGEPAEKS